MMSIEAYYPLLLLTLLLVEEGYIMLARRYNIVDRITERGSNKYPSVYGGGIIFYIAALLSILINPTSQPIEGWFLAGLSLVALISMIDDIKNIKQLPRLLVHFLAVALLFVQCGLFTAYPWWILAIAMVFCVGTINAYNFMDGINGMTALYSLVVLIALSYINQYLLSQPFISSVLLHSVTLAVLIFAFYNVRGKARCMAGDVGAISIAFIIVYALVKLILATGNICYLALLLVYGVDTTLTIVHRIILRHNIAQPHRMHVYQILANEYGWSHLAVSLLYMMLQVVVFVGLLFTPATLQLAYFFAVLALLSVAYIAFICRHFYSRHKRA